MAASFEDVKKELAARKRGGTTREGPGIEQSFLRGLGKSRAPASRMASIESTTPAEKPRFERPEWATPLDESRERHRIEAMQLREEPWRAIPEPVSASERIAEGLGEAAPYIAAGAAFAPLLAPAAPLTAAASELALGTLGTAAAEATEEAGGGPLSQFGAEVFATAAAPLATPTRVARRVGQSVARSAGEEAFTAATAIAAKHGVPPEAILRASGELKRKIARGTKDPDKYIRKASDRLGEDIEIFGETTPTLSQSAGEFGGQNLASMELNWAKADQDYAADALGRRYDVLERVEGDYAQIRPEGSYGAAREGFSDALSNAVAREREAWSNVPLDEMRVDTAPLARAAAELREGTKASQQYLPSELSIVDKYRPTESLAEIQDLRSELLETQRDAARMGATSADRRRGKKVAPLLKAIDEILETLPEEGSEAYLRARRMTAENRELFNPKAESVIALSELAEPSKAVNRIRNAKDPTAEAARAVRMLGGDETALDGLRAAFFEDVFGSALGDKTAKSMANKIDDRRGMFREVFGEDGLAFIDEVIKRQRTASSGKVGTSAQAASTGTGQAFIGQLLSYASDAQNPAWAASKRFMSVLGDKALSRTEVVTLLRLASQDIRLAKALLDVPVPRAEPAWRVVMMQGIARARNETAKAGARNLRRVGPNETE